MPPSQKRKLAETTLKKKNSTARQGIQSFGKVSKPYLCQGKSQLDGPNLKADAICKNSKKRKFDGIDDVQNRNCGFVVRIESNLENKQDVVLESPLPKANPTSNGSTVLLKNTRSKPSVTETPTKGARSCLELLALASPSPSDLNSLSPSSPDRKKRQRVGKPQDKSGTELPPDLRSLIDLHTSFLAALSLYCAHNGSSTSADLRSLTPTIERSWRKQRVSTDDVRRLLALLQDCGEGLDAQLGEGQKPNSTLSLSDYGGGKIFVEIEAAPHHRGVQRQPINEEDMKNRFTSNLLRNWKSYLLTNHNSSPSPSPSTFICNLPLAPIKTCTLLSNLSPSLTKGQRRLEDLKSPPPKTAKSSPKPPQTPPSPHPVKPTAARRTENLLARIHAKQLHQSTLAPPPSPTTLLRNSALQRLEEIAPVLTLLTNSTSRADPLPWSGSGSKSDRESDRDDGEGSDVGDGVDSGKGEEKGGTTALSLQQQQQLGTCSFSMPTLVQHLQMSLRNPISKEEVVRCVGLLAEEVAPRWVRVWEVGRVVGVLIRRGEGVRREEIRRRVGGLMEGRGGREEIRRLGGGKLMGEL